MSEALLLRGIRVVDPASRRDETADVAIVDGKVSVIGASLSAVATRGGDRPGAAGSIRRTTMQHERMR